MCGVLKRGISVFAIVALCVLSAACTSIKPPYPDMPSRSSLRPGKTVVAKAGENIYSIALRNRVSMREMIVLNDLYPPYKIKEGQNLVLPADGGEMAPPDAAPLAPVEKQDLAPIMPASVSSQELEPASPAPEPQSKPTTTLKLGTQSSAEPDPVLDRPAPSPKPVVASTTDAAAAATDVSGPLKWPLQGPILSTFGSKAAGVANDGINIGAPKGSPVGAAAAGTVAYAGNDMKGFGNLVLVKHQGDLVTAYAHLDRVLVKKDSTVAQGDMIGTVGKTGNVTSPQLHFEVRQSGKPIDPRRAIKASL